MTRRLQQSTPVGLMLVSYTMRIYFPKGHLEGGREGGREGGSLGVEEFELDVTAKCKRWWGIPEPELANINKQGVLAVPTWDSE